jgi:nucleotide-binding universal stress UspA family protein
MFDKILLCVDGSHRTEGIVAAAAEVAKLHEAALHVVCVVDPAYFIAGQFEGRAGNAYESDFPAAALEHESAIELVRQVTQSLASRDLVAAGHVMKGEPVRGILSAAEDYACDMILLSHRHLSWLKRFTHASICGEILELSPVPVLVIPDFS